jgi:hypothetical protein
MRPHEHVRVEAPPLFDAFHERRTRGQRKRAALAVVYTAIHRVQVRLGRA